MGIVQQILLGLQRTFYLDIYIYIYIYIVIVYLYAYIVNIYTLYT